MSPTDNDAGTTTVSTVSQEVAGTPGDQPDYKTLHAQAVQEAAEWKNRFNGIQGTYQREQAKWKTDLAANEQLKSTVDALTSEKSTLQAALEETKEKLSALETEKDVSQAGLERMKIVVGEFPELTQFLAKGLIPDETGDELRAKLKELSKTIGEIKTGTVEAFRSGESLPQPPKPKDGGTAKDLQARLIAAFKSGNQQEYNEIYNDLLKHGGQT